LHEVIDSGTYSILVNNYETSHVIYDYLIKNY